MKVYTGKDLQKLLRLSDFGYECRDLKPDMDAYLQSDNPRVLCLYGLRRTGKTTLMQQCMRGLPAEDTAYILCANGDRFYDLDQELLHLDKKYLFLDEVTKLSGFLSAGSLLADSYSAIGHRVVMTGTDSLGFALTESGEFFDRVLMLHTTRIPYREYHRLLGKGILDYIRYGGTLTDGKRLYNEDQRYGDYTNSAIVENICHSLQNYDGGREYDLLRGMVSNGDLPSAIRKVLEAHTGRFLGNVINESFRSHDLGSLSDLLTKHRIDPGPIEAVCRAADTAVRPYLYIKRDMNWVTEEAIGEIEQYLERLDVVVRDPASKPERYLFTQPGMRYAQCEEELDALENAPEFSKYTLREKELVREKLMEDIEGQILEDVVFLECRESVEKPCVVEKVRDLDGHEVDVLVIDPKQGTMAALEVKRTKEADRAQWKHLSDEAFCQSIEKDTGCRIVSKAVLYLGPDRDGYRNVESFLLHPKEELHRMLTVEGYTKAPKWEKAEEKQR